MNSPNELFFNILLVHPQRVTIFAKAESLRLPSPQIKSDQPTMLPHTARRTMAYDDPAAGPPPELPPTMFGPTVAKLAVAMAGQLNSLLDIAGVNVSNVLNFCRWRSARVVRVGKKKIVIVLRQ
jgi:hypothetical protein